ncbi:MAG: glutamate-1-semialdehyde 2,1-aminomutase [Candidatus Hodarchaeota archaeon]
MKTGSFNNSENLYAEAVNLMPGGVNSPVRAFKPHPLFIKMGKGSHVFDVDDNIFIDYCMAFGPLILGHAPPEIVEAVRDQLVKGSMYGIPTPLENELAKLVIEGVPSIELVRLVNTGTEATMSAIRLARGYTGRDKILKFEGCYHGSHDAVLVKAGSGALTFGTPTSLGILNSLAENTLVLPYNDLEALDKLFAKEGENIAAVILEPVVGNAGLIVPKPGYLDGMRKITEEYDTLLIFDEVITGFRLGFGGAQEYFNIDPDLTTLGKILGHGFPIAAYGGKKEIMEMVTPTGKIYSATIPPAKAGKVYQAGTFSGNPISVIAGIITLKMLKNNPRIYQDLERKTKEITKGYRDLAEDYGVRIRLNSIGSMWQVFFADHEIVDQETAQKSELKKWDKYFHKMLEQRVYLPPGNFETCFLSTAHTKEDVETTIEVASKAIRV